MAGVELRGVDMVYPGGARAVRGLDLVVEEGELLVLLGPSGCGKSTILRLIAGLETPTAGEILIDGEPVAGLRPRARNVAMVFQSYALYPHMSVRENLEFPLRMRGISRVERRRRAEEVARLLELGSLLDRKPRRLSGGQQQRVAMGRALVRDPAVFLLDEPLSNLDAHLRGRLRTEIARLQERVGVTTVYVTHDQVEAMTLGHRVALLREGRLRQVGAGRSLYDHPADTFVASFLGQPGMNLFRAGLRRDGPGLVLELGDRALSVSDGAREGAARAGLARGEVIAGVRPEALHLEGGSGREGTISGVVSAVEVLGAEYVLHVESYLETVIGEGASAAEGAGAETGMLAARVPATGAAPDPGDRVELRFDPAEVRLFDAEGAALSGALSRATSRPSAPGS